MIIKRAALNSLLAFTLAFNVFSPNRAEADADDPPSRVARVAFIEGSVSFQPAGTQDWVALGPREVYVPPYPVSLSYVRNINVSNTTVNTTVINNVYNTIVINKKTVDITYVNRAVPGAVTATSTQAFAAAQPVERIKVDQRAISRAPVRALAPAVVPTKQAVLGSSPVALAKPPASVHMRPVVARTPPPPPPPPFELRQEAIKKRRW
jgi:hypothetical protein